jgi:hypothetical protein
MNDRAQFESNFEGIFGKRERPRPVFEPIDADGKEKPKSD